MILRRLGSLRTANRRFAIHHPTWQKSNVATPVVDELGVPLSATWSVKELLSTYPAPSLSHDTLARLHRLSALNPPAPGSSKSESLRLELQELLRLVEAVKLVDTSIAPGGAERSDIPDSRIWAEGRGLDLYAPDAQHLKEAHGEALLKHAKKHVNGQYVVETNIKTRGAKAG
ncbi:hypothetical protein BDV93DRAFT_603314 [Ceratobasidium sp. AG-I]|nr:hypothetical protein BDV93DRAFT_603314 [Ceratobasidium sp. AG-I]